MTKLAAVFACLAACASEEPPSEDDAFASGPIIGTPPFGSRVAAIWVVTEGEDYAYKFGGGDAGGGRFTVSFDGEVPGDALRPDGWGYAVLMLVDEEVPDFTRIDEEITFGILGVDVDHLIVFRGANATPELPWVSAFPPGLSCGVCRRFEDPDRQDEATPTTCNTVAMTVGDFEELGGCNVD